MVARSRLSNKPLPMMRWKRGPMIAIATRRGMKVNATEMGAVLRTPIIPMDSPPPEAL